MPTPLHESIGSVLAQQFSLHIADLEGIDLVLGEDFKTFGGSWEDSEKRPDLGVEAVNANGVSEIKWVLETGFTETYEELVEDARLWLEGCPEVSTVVLVKFHETPEYRCPVGFDESPEDLGIPSDVRAILRQDVVLNGEYGPAYYKDIEWVGQISEAFMEIWVRNNADGRAVKRGNRRNLFQATGIRVPLGDFMPPGSPQTIALNLNQFRSMFKRKIQKLAVNRCADWVKEYKRIYMGGGDRDYQPYKLYQTALLHK